ncbi:MAG: polymerase-associated helicase-like protein, partial [Paenibacillus sp.]|nr:polymerase-associated helicase-like protein [Paenibacillus sp.]
MNTASTEHVRSLNDHLNIHFDRSWFEELETRVHKNGPWDDW